MEQGTGVQSGGCPSCAWHTKRKSEQKRANGQEEGVVFMQLPAPTILGRKGAATSDSGATDNPEAVVGSAVASEWKTKVKNRTPVAVCDEAINRDFCSLGFEPDCSGAPVQ
eukprot:evm.model.scf_1281EXC.9 EVM.evm.TU.scf_1281EXC.9   scf_1281EXC:38397-39366(+)